jgi:uncharacterized Zn-finger protein
MALQHKQTSNAGHIRSASTSNKPVMIRPSEIENYRVMVSGHGVELTCSACNQVIQFIAGLVFDTKSLTSAFSDIYFNLYDRHLREYKYQVLAQVAPQVFLERDNIGKLGQGTCPSCETQITSILCPYCQAVQCEATVPFLVNRDPVLTVLFINEVKLDKALLSQIRLPRY